MTLLELQTAADHAATLRARRRRTGARRTSSPRRASAPRRPACRLEAMLHDLQATALEATIGRGPRPAPLRARRPLGQRRYQGAGL